MIDMSEELDFEIRLENLPGPKAIAARTKLERDHMIAIGEFIKRCANNSERSGIALLLRRDGQITISTI